MFGQHLAALDAAVFAHLSDDVSARWSRGVEFDVPLAAMRERIERTSAYQGIATVETLDVVRVSGAEVEARRPADRPVAGDVFTVSGRRCVVHGTPWQDETSGGRDWLCPVS